MRKIDRATHPESAQIEQEKTPESNAPHTPKKPAQRRIKTEYVVAMIGAVATIIAGILSSPLIEKWLTVTPAPTTGPTVAMTATSVAPTQPLSLTEGIPELAFTDPHPDDSDYLDPAGIPMRLVSAGEFDMGSETGQSDERPVHAIYLDAYYIDKYEVTNLFYQACVDAGACRPPENTTGLSFNDFYGKPEFAHYPVLFINWDMAKTYCEWRGAELPTEAQWEKAARGTDGRTYPWGEEIDQTFAHYANSSSGPAAVGTYEKGTSPFGVYDMAGNAVEWVSDWYSNSFYANSPDANPSGPGSGQYRVLRGGTWYDDKDKVRASDRMAYIPDEILTSFGFRCAKDVTP
jgi:formylglycine-generating enzyme required for sulfatase activity